MGTVVELQRPYHCSLCFYVSKCWISVIIYSSSYQSEVFFAPGLVAVDLGCQDSLFSVGPGILFLTLEVHYLVF
jgi:hypothetical protein